LGDAGRGVELEARFGPGGNAAGTALRGFDGAVATLPDVLAGGGLQDAGCVLEAVDGGKRIGGRVALEGGLLLGGDGGEALAEALGVFGLGDGFAAVEVGAAGVGPGVGAEVETVAGTQGETGLGLEFGAVAAVGLAGVAGSWARAGMARAAATARAVKAGSWIMVMMGRLAGARMVAALPRDARRHTLHRETG